MSVSLYRRFRPQTFEEIAGQETVVDVLKKTLQRNQTGHAWLFSGPRGCGKTTAARLLAKALNCTGLVDGYEPCGKCAQCISISSGDSLDVVEIDGASNNGVEEIRELKTHVSLSPFSARWKVYIIDEVHMLSISAFNALLKTLEEPPPYVVFILATTEPQKVPATIRSRCRHLPFHRIEVPAVCSRLSRVASEEKIPFDPDALREIARHADGALRDALSLLEQAASLGGGEVSKDAVDRLLGGGTLSEMEKWVSSLKEEDVQPFLSLDRMFRKGASPQRVVEGVFLLFRNLWAVKRWGKPVLEALALSESEEAFLEAESGAWTQDQLSDMMQYCSKLIPQVRAGLRTDVLSGLLAARALECRATPAAKASPPVARPPFNPMEPASETAAARPLVAPPRPVAPQTSPPVEPPRPATPQTGSPVAPPQPASRPDRAKEPLEVRVPAAFDSPVPDEIWREVERRLFEGHISLYCLLVGATIAVDEKCIEIRIPDDGAYTYATLCSERKTHELAAVIDDVVGGGRELVLAWGEERSARAPQAMETKPEPEEASSPAPVVPPARDEASPQSRGQGKGIPFEGIVDEVLRWTDGEVVLVRREEREDEPPPAGEQE